MSGTRLHTWTKFGDIWSKTATCIEVTTDKQTDRQMKWQSGDCELAKIWQNVRQLWHQYHLNTGKWLGTKLNANGVEKKRGGECVIGFASEIYSLYWIASIFHRPNGCITLHLS